MPASPGMALFGVRRQAHPEEPGGVHTSFTYPVPSLQPAKEHVGGIQTVEVAASGQAGTGQGHHGGEDVQHTVGGSDRQPWPGWPRTLLAMHAVAKTHLHRPKPSTVWSAPPPACPSLTFHLGFSLQAAERPSGSAPRLCDQGLPGIKSQCCHLSSPSGLRFSVL